MRRNIIWMAIVAIVAAMTLSSCSDNTPSGVVKTYFAAMKSGNAKKAVDCTNVPEDMRESRIERYERQLERDSPSNRFYKSGEVEIVSEEIEDDRAYMDVAIVTPEGAGMQVHLELVKVDGEWKIDE